MLKAVEHRNIVVLANAVELVTESVIKLTGGQKQVSMLGSSRQCIADGVAARINTKLTMKIGG